MPVNPIGGSYESSAVWPPPSTLQDRMQETISAFAEHLAVRRDEIVSKLAQGRSLAEIAGASGVSLRESVQLAANQLAWEPGRPAMDPSRLQSMARDVVTFRPEPGHRDAAALLAGVASGMASAPRPSMIGKIRPSGPSVTGIAPTSGR